MNLWSLNKDIRIKECLLLLEQYFEPGSYIIDFEAPCADQAIYLTHRDEPQMRAYLFTLAQSKSHFGIQLEFPRHQADFATMETYEELSIHALAEILSVHLDLIYKP